MNPMMGSIMQSKLSGLSSKLAPIRNMMNTLRNTGNPSAMMQQMAQQNPQIQQVMKYVNEHGGDPQKAFNELAQQLGIDGNEILKMLK